MKSRILPVILTAAVTSLATIYIAGKIHDSTPYFTMAENSKHKPVNYASYTENGVAQSAAPVNFENAAAASVKAVVHIKTKTGARLVPADDIFGRLFGQQYYIPQQMGSGSGVVISADGYIVTNNHVVSGADQVTVTFNDRYTSDAKVVATDPSTDIAVLKVGEKNLPYMEFGNSDDARLGQWVLAVGYPLTLDATVTAGIISAKGRSIGINKQQSASAVESFIQTDAAVNPGNSGGALVNTDGQLIGINSAIASPTGSYAGYSYAIPSNLVRKVVNDLVKFGAVKRGYLGAEFLDPKALSAEELNKRGLVNMNGVYIERVLSGSGAEKAGLKKGDIITEVNGVKVTAYPELQEQIARYHPGDNVNIAYSRSDKPGNVTVRLGELNKSSALLLGAQLRELNNDEKKKYNIDGGLAVVNTGNGILAQARIPQGFVIIAANEHPVSSIDELQAIIANSNAVQIAGFIPGRQGMYYYNINNTEPDSNQQ